MTQARKADCAKKIAYTTFVLRALNIVLEYKSIPIVLRGFNVSKTALCLLTM